MSSFLRFLGGLSACLLLLSAAGRHPASAASDPVKGMGDVVAPHDFHVSYGRMAVEGEFAVCNIRFFKDDLTEALQVFAGSPDFVLDVSPQSDSVFVAYLSEHFELTVDGESLSGTIMQSGEDVEGKEQIWWYTVQYEAAAAIEALRIRNTLLTERFDEQKNIVKIQHFPSENTLSYYFDTEDTAFDVAL